MKQFAADKVRSFGESFCWIAAMPIVRIILRGALFLVLAFLPAEAHPQEQSVIDSAIALIARGDHDGAIEFLTRTIPTAQDKAPIFRLLGQEYFAVRQWEAAAEAYRDAAKANHCDSCYSDVERVGVIYVEAGKLERAEEYFEEAYRKGSRTAGARLANAISKEGDLYFNNRDYDNAADAFKRSLAIHEDTLTYYHLLLCDVSSGNYDQALRLAKALIEKYPGFAFPRTMVGTDHYATGVKLSKENDFQGAIRSFKSSVEVWPNDPSAYTGLGICYEKIRDTAQALENYDNAIRLGTTNPQVYVRQASIYRTQGRLNDAIVALQNYLKISNVIDNIVEVCIKLSDLYASSGDRVNSRVFYRLAARFGCDTCLAQLQKSSGAQELTDSTIQYAEVLKRFPWLGTLFEDFGLSKSAADPADFVPVDRPPAIIKESIPEYPDLARRIGAEGTVWIKMLVDKNGRVKRALVVKSDNELFNESSVTAALQYFFTPALMNNGPVAVWVSVPFRFKLHR